MLLMPNRAGFPFRSLSFIAGLLLAWIGLVSPAEAQDEKKVPPPLESTVLTKDGVGIRFTYYPGMNEKESVPIILLHELKGNRRDLEGLALSLQKLMGAAVIAPDLRGHGDSTLAGTKKLDANTFNRVTDFLPMIDQDVEAVKKFLVDENNKGNLNIDRLAIVGIQMGASIGSLWGMKDWTWPILTSGKQGQDLKALVLISPSPALHGLNLSQGLNAQQPAGIAPYRTSVAVMVIAGDKDPKARGDAERVANIFKLGRTKEETDSDDIAVRTWYPQWYDTKLQSTKLLSEASLGVDKMIAGFIEMRCGSGRPFPWTMRGTGQ